MKQRVFSSQVPQQTRVVCIALRALAIERVLVRCVQRKVLLKALCEVRIGDIVATECQGVGMTGLDKSLPIFL